jgi:succinate dehydrogenase / fumarate reductase membrane anchor subunit
MVAKLIAEMSLTGNGLRDWLVQRFSSIVIALYFFVLLGFFLFHPDVDYQSLRHFFTAIWMQVFTLTTLFCLFLHAWVGIWTVITDYVKPVILRITIQVLVILSLVIYFFWGLAILMKAINGA